MFLNKVILRDFRQYHDKAEIDFSVDGNKNVTVVHGENGVGKSALLNAIKWAFFGTFTEDFRNPLDLVNNKSKRNTCSVEVEFSEGDKTFRLIRIYDEQNKGKSTVKLFEKTNGVLGAAKTGTEADYIINSILPKEMAEYFFFQGEGSNALNIGNTKGSVSRAIRDVLGFKVAEKLIESLSELERDVRRKISEHDRSGEALKIENELSVNERNLSRLLNEKTDADEIVPQLYASLDHINEQLSKFSNFDLQKLRVQEKKLREEERECQDNLRKQIDAKRRLINKYGWAVYGNGFASQSLDFIDDSELKGKLPEPYNQTFIQDILSQKQCICGNCLDVGSEGYIRIASMLTKAANPILQQRLSGVRAQIQSISTLHDVANDNISQTISLCENYEERLESIRKEIEHVNDEISKIPEQEIVRLNLAKLTLEKDIAHNVEKVGSLKYQIADLTQKVESAKVRLNSIASTDDVISSYRKQQEFISALLEYLKNKLSETERKIRLHITHAVNDTLKKFSRHSYHIKVDENEFRFHLFDSDGEEVKGQGTGLNLLLNLTITAALISFAAQRKKVRDPILTSATVAPLIMDAPFGVLDVTYRNIVVKHLPEFASQIVFLVSSSQWLPDMDTVIRDKIGSEFCLVLEESSEIGSKPLDVIEIAGNKYTLSRYGCDISRTLIERVSL